MSGSRRATLRAAVLRWEELPHVEREALRVALWAFVEAKTEDARRRRAKWARAVRSPALDASLAQDKLDVKAWRSLAVLLDGVERAIAKRPTEVQAAAE